MEKLNTHIKFLESLIDDLNGFLAANGKNKTIRDRERSKISSAVIQLENYLNVNVDLAQLLMELHGSNDYLYAETLSSKYIIRDTERLIEFLKEKLAQLK